MQIVECTNCATQFRDGPETASVCPKCGHENNWATDEEEDFIPARKVIG